VTPATTSSNLFANLFPSQATTTRSIIGSNLQIGASGNDVITLQKFLESKGFLTMPTGMTEGYFGSLTKKALIAFQASVGLPATGYCGSMTRSVIGAGK
jgi:peptidoglycan hydrolase-like protein with peptidoglycan-binding domain